MLATSPLLDLGHLIGRLVPPDDIPPAPRRLGLALATPLGRKSPLAASAPGLATLAPDPSRAGDGLLVPRPVTALPALTLGLDGGSARSRSCAADLNGDMGRTDADADRDDEVVTTIRFVNGSTYRGALHEGEMHGSSGMYEWAPSGTVYRGEFARNRIEGRGRFMWRDGSEYEGDVSNNLRCGNGRIRLASGIVYEGQWVMSMPHGKGKMTYSESPLSFYEGSFLFGQRHGSGQMHYPSGAVYTGQWHEGVRHGRGTMVWPDLGQEYDGEWHHGLMHGRGIYLWHRVRQPGESPSEQYYHARNWYEGDFVDNQRHGKGAFQYADGSIYVGDFAGNQKHGNALFRDRYGRIHEGEWHRDQMVAPLALFEGVPVYQFPYPDGTEIGSIFRRHQAQLTHVYAKYATAPHLDDPKFKCGMTFDQLYLLLMDIGLRAHRMSLTRVGDLAEFGPTHDGRTASAVCANGHLRHLAPQNTALLRLSLHVDGIAQALYAPASAVLCRRARSRAQWVAAGVDAKTAEKLQVQVMIEGSVRAVVLDHFLTTDVATLANKRPRSASARVVSLPPPAVGHNDDDDAVATLMHVRARQPWLARPRVQHTEFMSLLGTFRAPVAALHAHRPHWHVGHVLQLLIAVDLVAVDDVGRLVHVLAGCIPWLTADAGIYLEYPLVAIELFEVLFEVFASSRPGADALSAPARPRPPTVPGFLPGSAPSPRNAFRPAAHLSRGTSAAAGMGTASAGAGDARKPGSSGHRAVAIAHAPSGHAGHDVLGASASTASATTDDNAATIAPAAAGTHSAGTASRAASTTRDGQCSKCASAIGQAGRRRPRHGARTRGARSARRLSAAKSEMLLAASSAASVAHDTSVRNVQDSGAAIATLDGRLGSHESSVGGSGRRLRSGASASFDNVAVTTVTWVKERVGGPTGSGAVAGKIAEAYELTGKLSTAAASGAATPGAAAAAVSLEEHVRARFTALFAKDEQLRWIARTLGD
ncbi:hypothetical protein AMAG_09856 [Allomyces macrogynus ATCC 38327]|uniref:Uncharacterized protein n=1 Tax=Allomyces macrogynus (strain ATCC 38327) TaxID=578462 RepID=A0A0L0STN1_ALLM3|nr:hypothetical protein AMAG_09856 [Allomyces macrogynus ATCC 38327]|eukprot:KNE65892.1 hypothetical protein AMAG_09856 [Allomyces macrogynus ATCC 38327]